MDEILYELREHSAGLNAGRWDYIFSVIKKLGHRPEFVLPDRARRDDGRAVHALLLRAAREDVPPTRRARNGRHGGLHPVAPRRGGERGRAREGARGQGARGVAGLRRHVGRASRSRPGRDGGVRRRARRRARTRSTAGATTSTSRRRTPRRRRDARRDDGGRACATTSRSGSSTSPPGCRLRRGRDLQPDGGRRHGRDQPLSDLAVAPSRPDHARTRCAGITDEEVARLGEGYEDARAIFEAIATRDDYVEFLTLPAYERLTATGA